MWGYGVALRLTVRGHCLCMRSGSSGKENQQHDIVGDGHPGKTGPGLQHQS